MIADPPELGLMMRVQHGVVVASVLRLDGEKHLCVVVCFDDIWCICVIMFPKRYIGWHLSRCLRKLTLFPMWVCVASAVPFIDSPMHGQIVWSALLFVYNQTMFDTKYEELFWYLQGMDNHQKISKNVGFLASILEWNREKGSQMIKSRLRPKKKVPFHHLVG